MDSLGSGCSNTPLERNNKPSPPKKRAQEEQTSSEEQRKQQRTEGTSHARPSDFQPQTGCDQEISHPPTAGLEDSFPVDCIDHVLASTEFVMHLCPDQHIDNILTDPQYGYSIDENPQNHTLVNVT